MNNDVFMVGEIALVAVAPFEGLECEILEPLSDHPTIDGSAKKGYAIEIPAAPSIGAPPRGWSGNGYIAAPSELRKLPKGDTPGNWADSIFQPERQGTVA